MFKTEVLCQAKTPTGIIASCPFGDMSGESFFNINVCLKPLQLHFSHSIALKYLSLVFAET